ncbi:transposable element Tcb2 transposase [Trichonephila clavipes]|nr:transposable element Tcb2 transposase [Trichonephila clavipes]
MQGDRGRSRAAQTMQQTIFALEQPPSEFVVGCILEAGKGGEGLSLIANDSLWYQVERGESSVKIRGVGTSGSQRCHLHEDQAQDVLDTPVVKKTATSDESRFNLSSDNNRVRVLRPRGKRLNPAFALQRHTAPTAGVMVWGVIAYNTRSPLVLIRCTMTAQRARPHTARVSQDCLRTVTTLPCAARSPDLSPIELIWDHLRRRVGHPTSLNELEASGFVAWGTLNSRRAASPLMRLGEGKRGDHPQCVLSRNWGETSETYCHLHGAQGYGKRQAYNLSLCHDEFLGRRSGTC